ncbi:E3 ubiquitin-protein ligase RNF180-like [Littorina saxatilis]|uniref:RING-type domain-containing protein n=1 Tax=Littorina saxatilis TaxID=31220 RepID=A0AAN9B2A6_9CAEN
MQTSRVTVKCRRCRVSLLSQDAIVNSHGEATQGVSGRGDCDSSLGPASTHLFVSHDNGPPWLLDTIIQACYTRGKVLCPKCQGRLGSFDFVKSARKCGCGQTTLPPVHLLRDRIDITDTSRHHWITLPSVDRSLKNTDQLCLTQGAADTDCDVSHDSIEGAVDTERDLSLSTECAALYREERMCGYDVDRCTCTDCGHRDARCNDRRSARRQTLGNGSSDGEDDCLYLGQLFGEPSQDLAGDATRLFDEASVELASDSGTSPVLQTLQDSQAGTCTHPNSSVLSRPEIQSARQRTNPCQPARPRTTTCLPDRPVTTNSSAPQSSNTGCAKASSFSTVRAIVHRSRRQRRRALRDSVDLEEERQWSVLDSQEGRRGRMDRGGERWMQDDHTEDLVGRKAPPVKSDAERQREQMERKERAEQTLQAEEVLWEHTCPMCLEVMLSPHTALPCRHDFCECCMRRLTTIRTPTTTDCPLCRQRIATCLLNEELGRAIATQSPLHLAARRREQKRHNQRFIQVPLPGLGLPGNYLARLRSYRMSILRAGKVKAVLLVSVAFVVVSLACIGMVICRRVLSVVAGVFDSFTERLTGERLWSEFMGLESRVVTVSSIFVLYLVCSWLLKYFRLFRRVLY